MRTAAKKETRGRKKMKHNPYWELFIEKYVECNHQRRAICWAREQVGMKAIVDPVLQSQEAKRLLNMDRVQELLDKARKKYLHQLGVYPEKAIAELAKVAFARLPDIFEINGRGEAVFDLSLMTPELEAAIGEYAVDTYMEGRGDDAREVKKVRVKLNNKLDALDKLMKYMGLYEKDNAQSTQGLVDAIRAGRERARDKR